jgi:hypothetical protein
MVYLPVGETERVAPAKPAALPPVVRARFGLSTLAPTPDAPVGYYHELRAAGRRYFVAVTYGDDMETVQMLAEAVTPPLQP